jgi:hypothetical protein
VLLQLRKLHASDTPSILKSAVAVSKYASVESGPSSDALVLACFREWIQSYFLQY